MTPTAAHWRTNSGNSVMTSMRIALPRSEIRIPIDDEASRVEIHLLDELVEHERNHPFAFGIADHEHVVGPGREQMRYLAQRHTVDRRDIHAFEVGPVVLAGLGRGQRR